MDFSFFTSAMLFVFSDLHSHNAYLFWLLGCLVLRLLCVVYSLVLILCQVFPSFCYTYRIVCFVEYKLIRRYNCIRFPDFPSSVWYYSILWWRLISLEALCRRVGVIWRQFGSRDLIVNRASNIFCPILSSPPFINVLAHSTLQWCIFKFIKSQFNQRNTRLSPWRPGIFETLSSTPFMEHEASLPCSQKPAYDSCLSQINPVHTLQSSRVCTF